MADMKTIRQWADEDGLSYNTMTHRRLAAGVGRLVPPGTWLLTKAEWNEVKHTPLPGCTRVL
jgi:hypothetical protein